LFAEGLFFKFGFIEEVDAHDLTSSTGKTVVTEAFRHLGLIHGTAGVVHRGIKRSHILLHRRTDGNVGVYFLDFGSSI
jgi:hypothetical protein